MHIMLRASVCRVAAGAVISAALMAGSLGLTAAAASSCTGRPDCNGGPLPAAAAAGASTAINCPPPNPKVTTLNGDISDC